MKTTSQIKISRREYKWLLSQLAQLISITPNMLYSARDIAKTILKASIENKFIDSVCNQMRSSGYTTPTGNDVFYHLAGRDIGVKEVYACIDSMIKAGMDKAKKHIGFRKPLDIAIDSHDIPYYGKGDGELAKWVIGCENKDGTNKCFRFMTAHIVVKGRRFTIAALPISVFDNIPDLLERLIADVRKYVRIKYAFLDRGFYSVECIRKLFDLEVAFVVPVIKHKGSGDKDIVQLLRRSYNAKRFRFSYTLGTKNDNVSFTVVAVMGEEDVMGFATNTKLSPETIGEHYSKRWGIETGYRVKEEFRARTCARKSAAARLLLNMLPFALYNLWALVNLALRYVIGHGRHLPCSRSYITAYEFCKCIETFIDYG